MSFRCPECNMVSYDPTDERFGYCGNCNDFTGAEQMIIPPPTPPPPLTREKHEENKGRA